MANGWLTQFPCLLDGGSEVFRSPSPGTVKIHLAAAFGKLGIHNRVEAAVRGASEGRTECARWPFSTAVSSAITSAIIDLSDYGGDVPVPAFGPPRIARSIFAEAQRGTPFARKTLVL